MFKTIYKKEIISALVLACIFQALLLQTTANKLDIRNVLKSVSGNKILSFQPFMMRGKFVAPEIFDLFCSEGACKVPFSKDIGFNLKRKEILLLAKAKIQMTDLVAIDSAHGEVLFKDFRMWSNRGVYWDFKVNGAAYYASQEIIDLMRHRKEVNDIVFSCPLAFTASNENEAADLSNAFVKRKKHVDTFLLKEPFLKYERCHSNEEFEEGLRDMFETGVRWILYDGEFPRLHRWLRPDSCIGSFCLIRVSVQDDVEQ